MSSEIFQVRQQETLIEYLRMRVTELETENKALEAENAELRAKLERRPKRKMESAAAARWQTYEGFGETHTNAEWARRLNVPRNTLWRRLQAGATVEEFAAARRITYP